jgi:hypothetical protein
MALMNLLTAGRSLSEARERPHRYKVRSGALPKFGNAGAPGAATKSAASFAASERSENAVESQPMNSNTVSVQKLPGMPVLGEWARKINLFKPARPRAERLAVQGELSLDRVKPVRNDLSDSDLELVKVTRRPEATPSVVKIESVDVPVVKAVPLLARVRGLFQRTT